MRVAQYAEMASKLVFANHMMLRHAERSRDVSRRAALAPFLTPWYLFFIFSELRRYCVFFHKARRTVKCARNTKVRMLICSAAFTKENALMTVCLSCLSDPCDFKFLRMSHLIFMYRSDRCPAVDRVDLGSTGGGWVGVTSRIPSVQNFKYLIACFAKQALYSGKI